MYSRAKRSFSPILFVFLLVLAGLQIVPVGAQIQPQSGLETKNILILHSYEANTPVFIRADSGLSTTLESGGIPTLNQFYESLDLRRNPSPEHRRLLVKQMRLRYSHRKPDLIITMYPEALHFVLNDCRNILPDVPIIATILPFGFKLPQTDRRIIGHFAKLDILGSVDIAMKLFHGAKRVYIVVGANAVDKSVEAQASRDLEKWKTRLEFVSLSHMPVEEMLATVSGAPPDSVVLTLSFGQDVTGKNYTVPIVVQRLGQVSKAPIFGIVEHTLGYGIIGGSLLNFELIGKKAGQLALDILVGFKTPDHIPDVLDVPPVPMFDWRQLKRWDLSEAALPKGSIVINRETTFWDLRYYIIGGIAALLAQTALVMGLLVQRRRKLVAEMSLRQRTEELDQFFHVTLDLLCVANADGYFVRLNPAAERILGYSREELMTKRFFEFIHPDDLRRTQEAVSALSSQQKIFYFENRYRCKDGTYRWLEWSSTPSGNLIYAGARDVTERKQTAEILQEKEEAAREAARKASALAEIGRLVSSTLQIQQIYEAFAAAVQKIVPFDRIVINIIDGEKGTVKNVYMAGGEIQDREVETIYPLKGSGNAEIFRMKSTFLLQTEDFRDYQDRFPMLRSTFEAGFRSIMNVPLFSKGEVIGGLLLRSRKLNAYTEKDVRIAESIGNQIAGAIAIAQLFQDQREMGSRLRESEERFRQVAEAVGDFIWEVDANGLYLYTSPSVERILGYTPGELIGRMHFYDLFVPEVREELKAAAFDVFGAKQAFRAFPNPNANKEGKVVYLETSGVPMLDENGNLVGYRGADTDVTERRQAEQVLQEKERILRQNRNDLRELTGRLITAQEEERTHLARELHDDLSQRLAVLSIDAGKLEQELMDSPGPVREKLSDMKNQAVKISGDVHNLARQLHPSILDDLGLVRAIESECNAFMQREGVGVVFKHENLSDVIEKDVSLTLYRIVQEGLRNISKHACANHVSVLLKGLDQAILLSIQDDGIGFDLAEVKVTPGIGLSSLRERVRLISGEISIKSQPGEGTVITVKAPLNVKARGLG